MTALMTYQKPFALSVARAASEVEAVPWGAFRLRRFAATLKANGIDGAVPA